jgi:sister-chromatid-cohesion protein PDS5
MNVFEVSYLQSATRKSDLLTKLNDLHKQLSTLSQEVEELPKGLKQIASHLVSKRIIGHADKDVRLMASCCLVDIFRVYAPEAPFGDEEMVAVFEVIIGQLRSLSTHDIQSTIGQKTFYILSSISNYKSCVVPVILAQSGVSGASDLVTSLFEALVSSIRIEHTEEGIIINILYLFIIYINKNQLL